MLWIFSVRLRYFREANKARDAKLLKQFTFLILSSLFGSMVMEAKLPQLTPAGTQELDAALSLITAKEEPPGLVALVANQDEFLYHQAFGKQDVGQNIDMNTDSLFRIFSMTKPVTSLAIMMLYEEGLLDLDDPASKFLPQYKNHPILDGFNISTGTYTTAPAKKEFTIRHLLTHTAGFGYIFKSETVGLLKNASGKKVHDLPLMFEPGSQFMYGPNTHVLGFVVEALSELSLDAYFEEKIFEPLGMTETTFVLDPADLPRRVTRHERIDGKLVELPNPEKPDTYFRGDYGLKSTAQDYAKFLQMLLKVSSGDESQLIQPGTFALMAQNQIGPLDLVQEEGALNHRSRPLPIGGGRDKFGLGFQIAIMEAKHLRPRGSLSWSGIANTFFWIDPTHKISAVFLMQINPHGEEAAISALFEFEQTVYRNLN
tara:strand:- start:883 stop:2169 length:1287 start_codon:yes stop_codon:yes gene_type:complete